MSPAPMSIFRWLRDAERPAASEPGPEPEPLADEPEEASESEEISEQRERDIRLFFEHLKRRERIARRMGELGGSGHEYYCKACDVGFRTPEGAAAHERTEEHIQREDEFKHSQYRCGSYDKFVRRQHSRVIRDAGGPAKARPRK